MIFGRKKLIDIELLKNKLTLKGDKYEHYFRH
jgi:hypothetical protein